MKGLRLTLNLTMLMTFAVMVVSGLLAFFLPFSIKITGLHALMGFMFLWMIVAHVRNNVSGMKRSFNPRILLSSAALTGLLTALFIWQPAPVKAILNLSQNKGASLETFELQVDTFSYLYTPAENYQLKLDIKFGESFNLASPPTLAVWLENGSGYHVKTLFAPEVEGALPYWQWKVAEYEQAKRDAEANEIEGVDAVTSATPNASFDPRDYILPERNTEPFFLVVEVDAVGDSNEHYADQPSMLYRVEIDNAYPSYFQVLDIDGYTKYDEDEGIWEAYYPDERLTTSLSLIDSSLLTIER